MVEAPLESECSAPHTAADEPEAPVPAQESGEEEEAGLLSGDAATNGHVGADRRAPDGRKVRLAPGALRQMVIDHLSAHPEEAFTATRISRVIEKSSGAIANALVTLTKQGIAEQASEQPRTYRLAGSSDDS